MIEKICAKLRPSRVLVSSSYPKYARNYFKAIPEISKIAAKKDVFIRFSPVENPQKRNVVLTRMEIFEKRIDHVADIPEYAVEHQTGDQVYISWEKKLYDANIVRGKASILGKIKDFFEIKN